MLKHVKSEFEKIDNWDHDMIHDTLISLAEHMQLKNGTVMWPTRIAVSGLQVTPGGAIEILEILGKEESISRIELGIEKLEHSL